MVKPDILRQLEIGFNVKLPNFEMLMASARHIQRQRKEKTVPMQLRQQWFASSIKPKAESGDPVSGPEDKGEIRHLSSAL